MRTEEIQFIIDAVRKDKRSNLWIPPMFCLVGVLIAVFVNVDDYGPVMKVLATIGKWVVGMAIVAAGVYTLIGELAPAEKEPGIVALTTTPEKIVWAHVLVMKQNGRHTSSSLILGLDDGQRHRLELPLAEEAKERALAVVHRAAPRATLGFSPDIEAQFAKDPASLRAS